MLLGNRYEVTPTTVTPLDTNMGHPQSVDVLSVFLSITRKTTPQQKQIPSQLKLNFQGASGLTLAPVHSRS
ncbi:hypothetical protein [Calothrix sp. NIES-3974]|uniref:hypothetical protein n=1 Tax=Calothrix sp. NIES-3974 TaxID=2005462 RepID=UPI000B5FBEC5|nr:hypothetical protein [Calothrix sp. NIES-3974]BAZ05115.1 hypothetical protein NIES3974_17610 [Calothrix sp. NIES-3974]